MSIKGFGKEEHAILLLRIGTAFAFLYTGIAALLNPATWIGFVPVFIRSILPINILLPIHSFFNIFLSLWFISGRKLHYASIIASLALILIIVFNTGIMDIVFRDVTILFSIIALGILTYKKEMV